MFLLKLYLIDTNSRRVSISGIESKGKWVPLVSAFLLSVTVQVYHWLPVLNALHAPQAPILVAALTMGTVFFIFTIPLAYWLAGVFSRAGINSIERQTARLKRLRDERKRRTRDDDDFRVG